MRSTNRFAKHVAWLFVRATFTIFVSLLITTISFAATPSQAGVSWNYKLLGKLNSAQDLVTGLTIQITGSGSFDLSQLSITGGGGYTIFDAGGSIVGSGVWTATTFDSFKPYFPGGSPGEGGHLELEALFHGDGISALHGSLHVVIQCSMWGSAVEPPGYPWPPDFVEVGPYTKHITGAVMFNLNQ